MGLAAICGRKPPPSTAAGGAARTAFRWQIAGGFSRTAGVSPPMAEGAGPGTTALRKLALLGLTALLLAGAGGCQSSAERESDRLRRPFSNGVQQALKSGKAQVDLRELTPFEWDRFIVFPPLAPVTEVESKLGFDWPDLKKARSQIRQEYLLLVFVKGQKVVAWVDFETRRVDFTPLIEHGYIPRERTLFSLLKSGHRRYEVHLRPVRTPRPE
jgi:hypothetical protein